MDPEDADALAAAMTTLRWHPSHVRVGPALFLHGDLPLGRRRAVPPARRLHDGHGRNGRTLRLAYRAFVAARGPHPALYFSNPAVAYVEGALDGGRRRLTLHKSLDGGRTWTTVRLIHEGPAGYSDLAATSDGAVLCLYNLALTWKARPKTYDEPVIRAPALARHYADDPIPPSRLRAVLDFAHKLDVTHTPTEATLAFDFGTVHASADPDRLQAIEESLDLFARQQHQVRSAWAENPLDALTRVTQRNVDMWAEMQKEFLRAAGFGAGEDPDKSRNPE